MIIQSGYRRVRMKLVTSLCICVLIATAGFGQDTTSAIMQKWYNEEAYTTIINHYGDKLNQLSAKQSYFLGLSYYMMSNDEACLVALDYSLEQEANNPNAYYIQGMTHNYLGNLNEAIPFFKQAIHYDPENADYYSGMGDSYYNLKQYDNAVSAYKLAKAIPTCSDRPFNMIAEVYMEQNETEKARMAFYDARSHIDKTSETYPIVLYNIALMEGRTEHYRSAENALNELLSLQPENYKAISKLIQVKFAERKFDQIDSLKEILYTAHANGALQDNMKEMFCFDEFREGDKLIQAYERFEQPEEKIYYHFMFYVLDQTDHILYRVQTENSPITAQLGGPKFILSMTKGDQHYTFDTFIGDNSHYLSLKKKIVEVVSGELTPNESLRSK